MLRRIYLYGRLATEFGESFQMSVTTAGEAIRALNVNLPGFLAAMREGYFEIVRGDLHDESMRILEDNLNTFKLGNADLHIIPHIDGSKNGGGTLKIILGVALIGAAIFFSGGIAGLATPMIGSFTYGNLAMVGVALTLSGVATLLTPKAQDPNQQASFNMAGPTNSYAQGNPVPLIYGEVITGSQLISGSLDIEPIPVNWNPTNGNTAINTFDPETGQGVISGNPSNYTQPSGNT